MVREQLTKVLNLRISPGELAMLERLAEAEGLPMAALIRQLVRREHAAKFGDAPAKAPRPKRKP